MTMLARRFAVVGACAALLAALLCAAPGALAGKRWGDGYFPNSVVYDQDGKALHFYDDVIKNKIVVVSFIFTSCKDLCPLTTARLAEVRQRLGDAVGRDVFMVSITIDPEHDTPQALKSYAEAFQSGPGWLFLTGKPDEILEIRHKFGELSRKKSEHTAEVMLGNDRTGEWARDSAFSDPALLVMNIRAMDPVWRDRKQDLPSVNSASIQVPLPSLPGVAMFRKLCTACHTIGKGDHIGPDLNGVTGRRDHNWLVNFISDPDKARRSQDAVVLALAQKFKGATMPNLGLSADDANDLLAYIEAESLLHANAPSGTRAAKAN